MQNKTIAVVANQTSMKGDTHLVDLLLAHRINVKTVFAPEHGFRGKADAGEKVENGKDAKTGLPIVSLYGKNKKPTTEQLLGIDLVVFDIQDVGVRFYTYISTLSLVMEACAENGIKVLVLDRPNPNGYYVAGPVLKSEFKSFVGMHPVPVVYGLTIGEYGLMVNGEGWLKGGIKCDYTVIKCVNYNHSQTYSLPVKPSPNLPNDKAIELYPELCFFEGTNVSVGRGTDFPFQVYGAPYLKSGFKFTPKPNKGAKHPKYENEVCYGIDLRGETVNGPFNITFGHIYLMYLSSPEKDKFFNSFFDKLAGTDEIRKAIEGGESLDYVKSIGKKETDTFRQYRKKYLLYDDFY